MNTRCTSPARGAAAYGPCRRVTYSNPKGRTMGCVGGVQCPLVRSVHAFNFAKSRIVHLPNLIG